MLQHPQRTVHPQRRSGLRRRPQQHVSSGARATFCPRTHALEVRVPAVRAMDICVLAVHAMDVCVPAVHAMDVCVPAVRAMDVCVPAVCVMDVCVPAGGLLEGICKPEAAKLVMIGVGAEACTAYLSRSKGPHVDMQSKHAGVVAKQAYWCCSPLSPSPAHCLPVSGASPDPLQPRTRLWPKHIQTHSCPWASMSEVHCLVLRAF